MLPLDKVQNLIKRHGEIEKKLSSAEIIKTEFAELSKEYSDLNSIIESAIKYLNYKREIEDLSKIINDVKAEK